MAKDGTARGNKRGNSTGAGRKSTVQKRAAEMPGLTLTGAELPPGVSISPIFDSEQKSGIGLRAREVYAETYRWVEARGCAAKINLSLVEQYAMSVARWQQTEEIISAQGFLGRHPTTGASITSPYVAMSQGYAKQATACWYSLYTAVQDAGGANGEANDIRELVLKRMKGS